MLGGQTGTCIIKLFIAVFNSACNITSLNVYYVTLTAEDWIIEIFTLIMYCSKLVCVVIMSDFHPSVRFADKARDKVDYTLKLSS